MASMSDDKLPVPIELVNVTKAEFAWARVDAAVAYAKGMYFDGCHKIYLAMDDAQDERYAVEDWPFTSPPDGVVLRSWFAISCPLRFINAVTTTTPDPNTGYVPLIAQFELDDE